MHGHWTSSMYLGQPYRANSKPGLQLQLQTPGMKASPTVVNLETYNCIISNGTFANIEVMYVEMDTVK